MKIQRIKHSIQSILTFCWRSKGANQNAFRLNLRLIFDCFVCLGDGTRNEGKNLPTAEFDLWSCLLFSGWKTRWFSVLRPKMLRKSFAATLRHHWLQVRCTTWRMRANDQTPQCEYITCIQNVGHLSCQIIVISTFKTLQIWRFLGLKHEQNKYIQNSKNPLDVVYKKFPSISNFLILSILLPFAFLVFFKFLDFLILMNFVHLVLFMIFSIFPQFLEVKTEA